MGKLTTVLFGSIGTLVETSDMQRRAFNQAFAEAYLGWHWEPAQYKKMLLKSGGRKRIEAFAHAQGDTVDAAALHTRKTEIFDRMMIDSGLDLRPGVKNVIATVKERGMHLGFVSATSKANVDAVFSALDGALTRDDFAFVSDAQTVKQLKPAPDVYIAALDALGVEAQNCVAIEDTPVSLQAAADANIRVIAFPGAYATLEDFPAGTMMQQGVLTFDDLEKATALAQ